MINDLPRIREIELEKPNGGGQACKHEKNPSGLGT